MPPASLDEAHLWVCKVLNSSAKEIWLGQKVGVENGNEFSAGAGQSESQVSGFESLTVGPMQIRDVVASVGHATYAGENNIGGVVSRVVQDLNLQFVAGIFDGTSSFDDPLDYVALVEHGKLDGNSG